MANNLTAVALTSILFITGCAGYKIGSTSARKRRKGFCPTVINASKEPLLETALTPAIQREIITFSGLKLADKSTADATLEVRITDYDLDSIGFMGDDDKSSVASEYRAWIKADAKLINTQSGEIISEIKNISGKTTFIISDEMVVVDIVAAGASGHKRVKTRFGSRNCGFGYGSLGITI